MTGSKHGLTIHQSSAVTLRKTSDLMALTKNLLSGRYGLVSEESIELWLQGLWDWADENDISDDWLPRDKIRLFCLFDLDLSWENLALIPETLGHLTGLRELHLNGNQLVSLPESLGNLTGALSF